MAKKEIKIEYVQMMDRSKGLTLIGQPVEMEFGKEVREKLFDNDPNIILYPSVSPELKKNFRKVMGI